MEAFIAFALQHWQLFAGAGVVLAIGIGLLWFGHHERSAGAAELKTEIIQQTIQTQKKIDDAQASGPRTPADVSKRLRAHTF